MYDLSNLNNQNVVPFTAPAAQNPGGSNQLLGETRSQADVAMDGTSLTTFAPVTVETQRVIAMLPVTPRPSRPPLQSPQKAILRHELAELQTNCKLPAKKLRMKSRSNATATELMLSTH